MKHFLILLLLGLSLSTYSKPDNDSIIMQKIENNECSIHNLTHSKSDIQDINELKERINHQQSLNEQILSGISTQLDSASYTMTIFGILFAVAGLGLGIYVTYVERKIVKISEQNKDLLKESKQIKEHVDSVNKLIQSDLFNLFLKIKREETVHILDRLTQVPKDITNTLESLLSRELQVEDFSKLRLAYGKLKPEDSEYKFKYKIVFFQHFFAEVLKDEELKNDTSIVIDQLIQGTFENDIIKTTKDFTSVIYEVGLSKFAKEVNKYFKGLSESSHKDFEDVYTLLFTELKSRQIRFDLFKLIESTPENRYAKIKYGKLLRDAYSDQSPSEAEQDILKELENLQEIQVKFEEEQHKKEEERKKKQEETRKNREEQQKKKDEQKARQDAIQKAKDEEDKNADNIN